MFTAVFYLGEDHPELVGRTILIELNDGGFISSEDVGTSVWHTVSGLPGGSYTATITTELTCNVGDEFDEDNNSKTFDRIAPFTASHGIKQYTGDMNCPRCIMVCSDEDAQSSSSSSSQSLSNNSSSSSLSSMSSRSSEESSLSSGSSGAGV